jgi:predicted DNA-binding transcriptional regulator AlpA
MAQLIDSIKVGEKIAFSSSTVLNWAYGRKPAPPGFPPPVKVSNRLLWVESDVDEWIDSMKIFPKTISKEHGWPTIDVQPETLKDAAAMVKRGRGRPRKKAQS